MITFLAPPSTCARALPASVKRPVDSRTMSAPRSPHLRAEGSRSAKTLNERSPTWMSVSVADTSSLRRPNVESYLVRVARVLLSVRSFTATISMSAPVSKMARKKLRPMRPNPLIPTRTVMPRAYPSGALRNRRALVLRQHLGGERCLGVRDAELLRLLVRHRQQATYPAGDRVLGQCRLVQLPQLLERRLLVLQPQGAGPSQVVGHLVAEDLQRALHAGTGGHGRAGRAAQVRVVEVRQPVCGCPDLAPHAALLPGHQGLVCSEPGQQVSDRVTVADHDAVDTTHLARLGADAQAAGRPDECESRLGARAGDLERRGPAGLGERAVRQEGAAPGSDRVAVATGDHLWRQAADRSSPAVDQPGLPGECLAVLDHAYDVSAVLPDPVTVHHHHVGAVAVDLGDVLAEPPRSRPRVELGLDDDLSPLDV